MKRFEREFMTEVGNDLAITSALVLTIPTFFGVWLVLAGVFGVWGVWLGWIPAFYVAMAVFMLGLAAWPVIVGVGLGLLAWWLS